MKSLLALTLAFGLVACAGSGSSSPPADDGGSASSSSSSSSQESSTSGPVGEDSGLVCWTAPADLGDGQLTLTDQTESMGLVAPLTGMHGHAAIWADVDGDDAPDLYVGTFADRDSEIYQERGADGPAPDRLLLNGPDGFTLDTGLTDMRSRTSGGVGADLDADGDFDIVVSRNRPDAGTPPTQILENQDGVLVPLDLPGLGTEFGGRTVAVLDYDRDGALDLFISEDRFSGGSSVLLRNEGGLTFEDVTAEAGLPADIEGLGAVATDLNSDGLSDILVGGSNRLFIAGPEATFREVELPALEWDVLGEEDDVAGVSTADVNRDGTLDVVIGHHFNSTVEDGATMAIRLYLNRGTDGSGAPILENVTEASGLVPLPTKAPHVELNDFNNDGWPDILTSASSEDGARPAVFMFEELVGDVPVYAAPEGLGSDQYWVGGPSLDYDRDGRLDVFLVEWEPSLPSLLLRNETGGGHWVEVSVAAELGSGLGWLVEVFSGPSMDESNLLGAREITATQGYSSGVAPIAHFGLGEISEVSIRLTPTGDGDPIVLADVDADAHIRYPDGC